MRANEVLSRDDLSREDLLVLLDSGSQLAAQVDHDKLVTAILERACKLTDSPDGSVLLYDAERGGLFFAAALGEKGPELMQKWGAGSNQRVPLDGSKAGRAFTTGEMIVEENLAEDAGHFKGVDEQTRKSSQAMICVPLRFAGESIGVIQILNKREDYTPRDCVLLEHFAGQAATALKNARLIEKLAAHMGLYSRDGGARDLVERLDQEARRERLTMLFADMRGFTQLCQSQGDPARTQQILNDLLTMLAEQVLTRDGIVNKFLGDAVFALFRGEGGPQRAVKCAFGMLDRFESLRRRWDESCNEDLSFLDLGIGISTDFVALGSVGSATVRDFTAVGTAVNLAAAFEREARDGRRILIDQATWHAVKDIVADSSGPERFVLSKPGHDAGVPYRQYQLKRLKPDVPVRVFVSHNHRDREFIESSIIGPLARYGIETWYAQADLIPGEHYIEKIEAGLLKCDWVIVVVSANAANSDWVKVEVRTAIADPRFTRRILPVTTDDTPLASISDQLGLIQALDARGVANLGEKLFQILTAPAPQSAPAAQ